MVEQLLGSGYHCNCSVGNIMSRSAEIWCSVLVVVSRVIIIIWGIQCGLSSAPTPTTSNLDLYLKLVNATKILRTGSTTSIFSWMSVHACFLPDPLCFLYVNFEDQMIFLLLVCQNVCIPAKIIHAYHSECQPVC